MGLRDYTIYNIIKRNKRVYNDRIALISRNQRISHRIFLEKVDSLAHGLWRIGLGKGDRIAVLAQNSLEFIYLFASAAKIGAIMMPISWRLKQEEIEYIISDGSPKILFVEQEYQPNVTPLIQKFDFLKKVYAMGQARGEFLAFDELMQNSGDHREVDVCSDDDFVIIHTASVQGRPRGAILSHQNLITTNFEYMYRWHLTEKDVHLTLLPLFHLLGLGIALSVMQAGGLNVVLSKFDVDLALRSIQEERVTLFGVFPPLLRNLLDKAQADHDDLSSLRIVVGLDEPETIKKFESMAGATFWTTYGQSETSGLITLAPYFERPGSAGVPNFLSEIEIADEYDHILGKGDSGEIVVHGPAVFKGYWNLEKDTDYAFRDGWHHTGDRGRFDANGYLWYMGRKPEKELIKSGGENVYPIEVEKVILEHPLIEQVAVIGVPDSQWGEAIKAVCILKKGESLSETELTEFVATRIARFKKPKYVIFVPDLPKTEDGSINREKIKSIYGGAQS